MEQFTKYCEPIPDWSLNYIINGDPSGLTEEEIKMVDSYVSDNHFEIISPCDSEDEGQFTSCPAFGLPCNCIECWCMVRNAD